MNIEIRSARPEEMEEVRRVATSSILLPPGIFPSEVIEMITPDLTLCAVVDGRIATSYAAWPLTMRFNGDSLSVAGVTIVGTLPVYRRLGCLRRVIITHLERLHAQGEQPVAALFASQAAIYQRYGYGIVSTRNTYRVMPKDLRFYDEGIANGSGRMRELGDDEFEILNDVYTRFSADRIGYLCLGMHLPHTLPHSLGTDHGRARGAAIADHIQ